MSGILLELIDNHRNQPSEGHYDALDISVEKNRRLTLLAGVVAVGVFVLDQHHLRKLRDKVAAINQLGTGLKNRLSAG